MSAYNRKGPWRATRDAMPAGWLWRIWDGPGPNAQQIVTLDDDYGDTAKFIASAPDMAKRIDELEAALVVARGGTCAHSPGCQPCRCCHEVASVAAEALAGKDDK